MSRPNHRPTVLGLGGSGHDWSAAAMDPARIVAIDEERLTRKKYGVGSDLLAGLSRRAVTAQLGTTPEEVDLAVACDLVPPAFSFPVRRKLTVIDHHLAHAYSTFAGSGFDRAAVLVSDNSGSLVSGTREGDGPRAAETISGYVGDQDGLHLLTRVSGEHRLDGSAGGYYQPGSTDNSLGHFYRSVSIACGLAYRGPTGTHEVSEDGKTMGLASYGDRRFVDDLAALVDLGPGGGVRIDADAVDRTCAALVAGGDFDTRAALARAAQEVLERAVVHVARDLHARTGARDLCLAGGTALNSVANGRILRETPFERLFVVPAAGDNGISLGAAYYGLHVGSGVPMRELPHLTDAYLGPDHGHAAAETAIAESGLPCARPDDLPGAVAGLLAEGRTVGWFDGRSEFGPRALGHRSILSAPYPASVRDHLNDNVKYREWFRPYAPVVREERAPEYFDVDAPTPYMLVVAGVRRPDAVPAVTHVDGTARLQTLARDTNPALHDLLGEFDVRTGCPVLLNTSFNVAGEPIVETPEEAVAAFARMNLDHLVVDGRHLLSRSSTRMATA
ncbi:carbamoyltransferase C-terminal domain-containing protein [Nocardiopsis sp. RV163]|uniref:carbamoyltransferase family protein n=1 Tax=Nocardiopsis sp. RV163 TaxID=1661388 RepID=UPI00064C3EB3|nr:carbamoyltransferase C-terminal domain-containing protein [Nocardiopsis sp. RV163]